jgi:hypothetical protein
MLYTCAPEFDFLAAEVKGLEPKLHDLALSLGENKTLNFKDTTSRTLFQDFLLLISISSFV